MARSIHPHYKTGMTRYFFNLYECGRATIDEEGLLLATVPDAHHRAIEEARAIMCAEVREGRLCLNCNIEVVDAAGSVAVNVQFGDALTLSGA